MQGPSTWKAIGLGFALALGGCATSGPRFPGAPPRVASSAETGGAARSGALLTPLFVGWPQYFSIDWTALESGGRPVVAGHVLNDWGLPARRLQLLVDALDDRGEVIAQRLVWVTSMELMPGTRAYFEVPAPVAASRYRVSVFAFDWSGGGRS